jgi:hypothetical protein
MIARWRLAEANKRALKRWRAFHGSTYWFGEPYLPGDDDRWQRYRKTTKPCSCDMCGNPRKIWGMLTHQEVVAKLAMRDYAEA